MSKNQGCVRQEQHKYTSRPSPPYPANKCCGEEMIGNDGNTYVSVVDQNGVCRWRRQTSGSSSPRRPASPMRSLPTKIMGSFQVRDINDCMKLRVFELKQILSEAGVLGRSKLKTKDAICREILRLGL
jgi:hypothetical protein